MKKILKLITFIIIVFQVNSSVSAGYPYANHLSPKLVRLSFKAYRKAKCLIKNPYLTIVDYSLPSYIPRLWVIDMRTKAILFNTFVAHGKKSGNKVYATKFSNKANSHQSSIGVFLTGIKYPSKFGSGLKLHGLEKGFNSNAYARYVVMHGASYVDSKKAKDKGYIGRSHGCLSLEKHIAPKVINTIKGGSLIFSYYPKKNWLNNSNFLN